MCNQNIMGGMVKLDNTIIVALIAAAATVISAYLTKHQFTQELDKKVAVIDEKLLNLGNDVREHNHYAKLFSETIPVVQEQIKVLNHRVEDLEGNERRNH